MSMDRHTRQVFDQYCALLVKHTIQGGPQSYAPLPKSSEGWPIDDKVYDRFLDLVIDQAEFLARISNVRGFATLQGNIIRDDIPGHVLKRTNVSDTVLRAPTVTGTSTTELYSLLRGEWDHTIDYDAMRHWAKRGPTFLRDRINMQISKSLANDLLWVAFRGTSDGNPPVAGDIIDFAKGWLQLLREFSAGANFMSEVVVGSGLISIGKKKVVTFDGSATNEGGGVTGLPATGHGLPTGAFIIVADTTNYDGTYLVLASSTADRIDITATFVVEDVTGKTATHNPDYSSLDALAADLRNSVPQELHAGLEVTVSYDLFATEEETLYGEIGRTPTEKLAIRQAIARIADMPRNSPSPMPTGIMLVTPPANLAIYWHEELHRKIEDDPPRNGVTFWNDTNLDYILTDYRRAMAAENIVLVN